MAKAPGPVTCLTLLQGCRIWDSEFVKCRSHDHTSSVYKPADCSEANGKNELVSLLGSVRIVGRGRQDCFVKSTGYRQTRLLLCW